MSVCGQRPGSAGTRPDRTAATKRLVVPVVLVGVGHRELGQAGIEGGARSQVAGQEGGLAGPGMSARQRGPAEPPIQRQAVGADVVERYRPFHVPQLADVGVESVGAGPAQEGIAGGLQYALADHDPLALVGVPGATDIGSENGRLGFFDLQEQGIEIGLAGQQYHEAASTHTSHPDHLQGGVDELVAIQQKGSVGVEGGQIGRHEPSGLFELGVGEAHHHRRILHDHPAAVAHRGELGQRLQAGALAGLGHGLLGTGTGRLVGCGGDYRLDVQTGVPHLERRQLCHLGHLVAVLRGAALHRPLAVPIGQPGRSGRHHQTGRQPLDVPLPRSGLGFVEVVQIEDLVAFGRGEGAEVEKMGVAADLQLDARGRCAAQIGGHDRRGAPVEGERRRHHPAVPDGNQFG